MDTSSTRKLYAAFIVGSFSLAAVWSFIWTGIAFYEHLHCAGCA